MICIIILVMHHCTYSICMNYKRKIVILGNSLPVETFPWNFSKISLSEIGAAHALERENRKIKVLGCIKGIENNQAAQDQYFLIASEINAILDEFYCAFLLNLDDIKLQEHCQLIGSTNSRIKKMLKN